MKKLILKTAALTAACLVALVLALYLCFAVFSPKTLADFWSGMGNYPLSVTFYQKQYDKTGDLNDLLRLCDALNERTDAKNSVKALKELTQKEEFNSLNDKKDEYDFTSYEFYYGKYTVACFYDGGIDVAITVAKQAVQKGYPHYNAFYVLLCEDDALSKTDGEKIAAAIEGLSDGLSESEKVFATEDIKVAKSVK